MNRFPRKGDYLKFEKQFSINLGVDPISPNNNQYLDIPKGEILEILHIEIYDSKIHNGFVDLVPYGFVIGINNPEIYSKPIMVRFHYEIHSNFVSVIPGDNPAVVETLYGR